MGILVPLGYMIMIFILSSIPDTRGSGHFVVVVPPRVQNLLHIPAFGLLALLWIPVLKARGLDERRGLILTFLLASGYGALTELYQGLIPGRFPSLVDFLYDLIGILLFIGLYWMFRVSSSVFRVRR